MDEQLSFDGNELAKIKIVEKDGRLITTSLNVAHVFGKEHKNVLRTIDNLKMSNEFRRLNFELADFIDKNGETQRKFNMTRDGWTLLVMGFTGDKAVQFKEKYIAKFNEMEKALISIANPPLLPDFNDPVAAARAWADAKEAELKAKLVVEEQRPKVEFYDQAGDSEGLYSIGQAGKILGTGRNRLFVWLRKKNIFFGIQPFQEYINRGYFVMKTNYGNKYAQKQAFVTPKGLQWLHKKVKEEE